MMRFLRLRAFPLWSTPSRRLLTSNKAARLDAIPQSKDQNLEVPVSAYFIGNLSISPLTGLFVLGHKIDLAGVSGDVEFRSHRHGFSRDCVLFDFPGKEPVDGSMQMAVFRYGSIVFFNGSRNNERQKDIIEICRKYTVEPLSRPNQDGKESCTFHQLTSDQSSLYSSDQR